MRQGSLFDILPAPDAIVGLAGLMPEIRAAMNRVAGQDEKGRKMLVDLINEVAKREVVAFTPGGAKSIAKDTLDKWLQPGERGHEPSLNAILCFCLAAGNYSPLQPLFAALGLCVITADEVKLLEYGKSCDRLRKEKERNRKLGAQL